MEKLKDQYRKNSYDFNLVERDGDVAIFEQIDPDTKRRVAYEVFEVIKNPARIQFETDIPARESVPPNELWGKKGYTVWTLEAAKQKKEILISRIADRTAKNEF